MMKKLFFSSRSVHDEEHHQRQHDQTRKVIDNNGGICTSLTVWRKSLVINCNGFTVINSRGDLAYRVDNYTVRPHELILMDGSGKSIFTMNRHKKLGLVESWVLYEGEAGGVCSRTAGLAKKPSWRVKKHVSILQGNDNVLLADVYYRDSSKEKWDYSYMIEGSYIHRSCKIMNGSRKVVAEIKRKEAMIGGVSFGVEVFVLIVKSGFDPGFAMSLVLLLDQMFS